MWFSLISTCSNGPMLKFWPQRMPEDMAANIRQLRLTFEPRILGAVGIFRVVVLVLATTSVAIACGSASSPAGPLDCIGGCWTATPADEQFLTEMCTLTEACCVANAYRSTTDVEGCKKVFRRGGLSHDANLREACLAEMKSLAATGMNCIPEPWDLSDACLRVTYEPSGPQAPGEQCESSADCQGTPGKVTICGRVFASPTFGLCLSLTRGVAGGKERCLGTITHEGLIAAAAMDVAGQEKPVTTGPVCEDRAGLVCAPGADPAFWTCQPLTPDGATCNYSTYCASKQCLRSDGTEASYDHAGTCTRRVTSAQVCGDNVTHALCDATNYCQDTSDDRFMPGGVCVPKLAAGSACLNDAMCVSGTCDLSTTKACSTQTKSERLGLLAYCARL